VTIDPSSAPGLPVVNQAQEPAWVRGGSASTQKAYSTALAFEEILVQQLSQSLSATSGVAGEGGGEGGSAPGGESDAGSSELSSMLPQALSAGVMGAGGLGMAAQLTRELQGGLSSSIATKAPASTGGTAA
jgi:Rod binding domain-containing protein